MSAREELADILEATDGLDFMDVADAIIAADYVKESCCCGVCGL